MDVQFCKSMTSPKQWMYDCAEEWRHQNNGCTILLRTPSPRPLPVAKVKVYLLKKIARTSFETTNKE